MLSELQRRKLSRYFRVHDVDDDGRIGPGDFERVVENVRTLHGLDASSPAYRELRDLYLGQWESLREFADADVDGSVDLSEWLRYWDGLLEADGRYDAEVTSLVSHLFATFDTDEDGVLGPEEFADFHGIYGLSRDGARRAFGELDTDGDRALTHAELLEAGHEFFRGDDPEASGNRLFGPIG